MTSSSNGEAFRVTGHLCGEFAGHRWIPRTHPMTLRVDWPWIFPGAPLILSGSPGNIQGNIDKCGDTLKKFSQQNLFRICSAHFRAISNLKLDLARLLVLSQFYVESWNLSNARRHHVSSVTTDLANGLLLPETMMISFIDAYKPQ